MAGLVTFITVTLLFLHWETVGLLHSLAVVNFLLGAIRSPWKVFFGCVLLSCEL